MKTLSERWQRFIDKVAGGPSNEAVLAQRKGKSIFIRYSGSLLPFLFMIVFITIPEIINQLNSAPDPESLQTLQVHILRTYPTEPHLFVEMPDGSQRGVEWPVHISMRGGYRATIWNDEQRQDLSGCIATVKGAPIRFLFSEKFRIWSLDCPEREISISFKEVSETRTRSLATRLVLGLFVFTPLCVFFIFVFLREKRGHL